jgi:hypothetical protein
MIFTDGSIWMSPGRVEVAESRITQTMSRAVSSERVLQEQLRCSIRVDWLSWAVLGDGKLSRDSIDGTTGRENKHPNWTGEHGV